MFRNTLNSLISTTVLPHAHANRPNTRIYLHKSFHFKLECSQCTVLTSAPDKARGESTCHAFSRSLAGSFTQCFPQKRIANNKPSVQKRIKNTCTHCTCTATSKIISTSFLSTRLCYFWNEVGLPLLLFATRIPPPMVCWHPPSPGLFTLDCVHAQRTGISVFTRIYLKPVRNVLLDLASNPVFPWF